MRLILGNGRKQSEKNIKIKKGKQPRVSNPNIVLIKHDVIILMLITEKLVRAPTSKSNGRDPDVVYPTENDASNVSKRQINPIII